MDYLLMDVTPAEMDDALAEFYRDVLPDPELTEEDLEALAAYHRADISEDPTVEYEATAEMQRLASDLLIY